MTATAVYWQHHEKIRKRFATEDEAHDHMTDLWAEGECSPIGVVVEGGEMKGWRGDSH
ncbi:hypothetical protein ABZ234_03855 [Nocardiopsis sp. NPDC006198]|uniref:hypothetical protein n=1 Tax=Nocardiopsis sp. NPDC006198 TaxID=3154472 RepID=UPI0033B99974